MIDTYTGHLENVSQRSLASGADQQAVQIPDIGWVGTQTVLSPSVVSDSVSSSSGETWTETQRLIGAILFEDKRSAFQEVLERFIALNCLILASPVLIGLGLYIWIDSPGWPIFSHYRVGKEGKLFRFYKFRTLYIDAKKRFPDRYAYRYSEDQLNQLFFKVEDDPRITRAGRFLRRSTLDELPNFWNVLKGDMALVGPRPEIPEMLPYYRPAYLIKFCVKPGVTGLAQVSGRGRLLFRRTEELDAASILDRSMTKDFSIMLKTVYLILKMDGAF